MSRDENYLVADIGGTNSRIAVGDRSGSLTALQTFSNDRLNDLQGALLAAAEILRAPRRAVLAFAGPVDGDELRLTNRAWSFSRADLARTLDLERLLVVNDFVAMAHSAPALDGSDLAWVNGGPADPSKNMLVCGPGTGFGAAVLVRNGNARASIATEAGHMVLGATGPEESEVFSRLSAGRLLAVEDVLSGRGLRALHQAMSGSDVPGERIIAAAEAGEAASMRTIGFFMGVLGRVAGDLALAFDARGGVFIGGGVGRALRGQYQLPVFRRAFEAHHPYERRLREFPLAVILHPYPGLIGALELAKAEFA